MEWSNGVLEWRREYPEKLISAIFEELIQDLNDRPQALQYSITPDS